jgi:hypothetical protein
MPLIPTGDLTPALSATDALPDSGRWNQSQVIEAHQMMRWLTESAPALDYPVSRVSSNALGRQPFDTQREKPIRHAGRQPAAAHTANVRPRTVLLRG